MIREAITKDLDDVLAITELVVRIMNEDDHNFQWTPSYPNQTIFLQDIEQQQLFVYVQDNQVVGFIVINEEEPLVYQTLDWASEAAKRLVIHRMAVHPDRRKMGIAKKLFSFAEKYAKQQDTYWLRVDTNSINRKMNALIQKLDYQYVGQIDLKPGLPLFNCYEKSL